MWYRLYIKPVATATGKVLTNAVFIRSQALGVPQTTVTPSHLTEWTNFYSYQNNFESILQVWTPAGNDLWQFSIETLPPDTIYSSCNKLYTAIQVYTKHYNYTFVRRKSISILERKLSFLVTSTNLL